MSTRLFTHLQYERPPGSQQSQECVCFLYITPTLFDWLITFLRLNINFHAKCFIHYISTSLSSLPCLDVASSPVSLKNTIRNHSNGANNANKSVPVCCVCLIVVMNCVLLASIADCTFNGFQKAPPSVVILHWQLLQSGPKLLLVELKSVNVQDWFTIFVTCEPQLKLLFLFGVSIMLIIWCLETVWHFMFADSFILKFFLKRVILLTPWFSRRL